MKTYIVEFNGEPVTRLSFEGRKANVHTGSEAGAIRYTGDEAAEVVASIGRGAEAVMVATKKFNVVAVLKSGEQIQLAKSGNMDALPLNEYPSSGGAWHFTNPSLFRSLSKLNGGIFNPKSVKCISVLPVA